MEIVDFDKAFAALVDEAALKQRIFRAPFVVGPTPEVLQSLGYRLCPVLMPASVVDKAHEQHGISIGDIKSVPRQLRSPVVIFESDTQPNSVNILTNFRNRDGKPVTIAIHFDAAFGRDRAHKIATITERSEAQVELWKAKGLVRYEDAEKQKAQIQSAGLQLPGEGSTPDSNIPRKTRNVNRSWNDGVNNVVPSQEKQRAQTQIPGLQLPGKVSAPARIGAEDAAREETQIRLTSRTDLTSETKERVSEFLKRPEAGKIWKSQTLDLDGRIAAARLMAGEATFEQVTKDLPEIQHGVVRALARAHARGQERGPQFTP